MSNLVILVSDGNKKLDIIKAALKNINIEVLPVFTGYELTSAMFKYNPRIVIFETSTQWIDCFEFVKETETASLYKNVSFMFLCDKVSEKNKSLYELNGITCVTDSYQIADFIKNIESLLNK